jgi:hypothetical protein
MVIIFYWFYLVLSGQMSGSFHIGQLDVAMYIVNKFQGIIFQYTSPK